ncbi:MAG: diphthamide synthesis protein [Nanoarchaeota archaeon]|nr:diphthamide synthesis protein [Nanoarchaeota archaeon]
MEIVLIDAKSELEILPVLQKVKQKVKGKIGLVTTIQHFHRLKAAKTLIPDLVLGGQILGCDVSAAVKIKDEVDVFVYVGTGHFHPVAVAIKTGKDVYIANPVSNEVSKVPKSDIEAHKKKIKGKYLKFLNAKKIGILVSTKSGQYNLEKALKLQIELDRPSYIFLANHISESDLENYPDIDIFINTACPRIDFKNIINIEGIEEMVAGKIS